MSSTHKTLLQKRATWFRASDGTERCYLVRHTNWHRSVLLRDALFNEFLRTTMRNSPLLFVSLMYRMKSFRNVVVLMFLLEVEADKKEYACSIPVMANRYLGNQISRREAQKAVSDLEDIGLISLRVHANTKIYFKVNGDMVLSLLDQPLPEHMPGLEDLKFPFLEEWSSNGELPLSGS